MQEYIKLFNTPQDADNYKIKDIPFFCYVNETGQSLVCNQNKKILKNIDNELDILKLFPYNFIDLGLSVKWAQYNAGVDPENLSTAESWYGDFYAWGETETKSDYSWNTYTKHTNGTYSSSNKKVFIKYIPTDKTEYWGGTGSPDNKLILDSNDDLYLNEYHEDYGNQYRMPTKAEIEELKALSNQWVTDYNGISGLNGRVFTGVNGNTLFIPAAGYLYGSTRYYAGSYCYLWSSSLNSDDPSRAWYLGFNSDGIYVSNYNRYYGRSVRCVSTD